MDTNAIKTEMLDAARKAEAEFRAKYGEPFYCGFAWVTIYPKHKGNTKDGRAERQVFESLGFKKDWTGKAYQMWNPGGSGTQSMDVKETGAQAAADVLRKYGFNAYMGSRAD